MLMRIRTAGCDGVYQFTVEINVKDGSSCFQEMRFVLRKLKSRFVHDNREQKQKDTQPTRGSNSQP